MKIYQVQKYSRIRASLRPGGARSLYFLNTITYPECQRIHPYPEYESKYFFCPVRTQTRRPSDPFWEGSNIRIIVPCGVMSENSHKKRIYKDFFGILAHQKKSYFDFL